MLVRIPVAQVQLGMFVHSIECSWLDNPFWRSRYILENAADLALLRRSGVTEVTIDPAHGATPKPAAVPTAASVEDVVIFQYLHSVAVCMLMTNLARQLGMIEKQVQQAGITGLLHDIGKKTMPGTVLDKLGALDPDERRIIRDHPSAGDAPSKKSVDVNQIALDVCLHRHERVDGGGYPFGLQGDELSVSVRMGAICDGFDAITSVRPCKRPWTPNKARVRAFYDIPTARFVPYEDISTLNAAPSDPILRTERGERWFGDRWQEIETMVGSREPIPVTGPPTRDRSRTPAPGLAIAGAAR